MIIVEYTIYSMFFEKNVFYCLHFKKKFLIVACTGYLHHALQPIRNRDG